MQYAKVTPQLSVSPQLSLDDIDAIKAAGFKSIICNRPDGEGVDQPDFAEIEAKALSLGLSCIYQPVVSGKITPQDATTFEANLQKLQGPVLAYCRTGTRCITLWAMTASKSLSYEAILGISQKAGYDVSGALVQVKPS